MNEKYSKVSLLFPPSRQYKGPTFNWWTPLLRRKQPRQSNRTMTTKDTSPDIPRQRGQQILCWTFHSQRRGNTNWRNNSKCCERNFSSHTKAGKSEEGEAPPPSFFPGWDPVSVFFYCVEWGGGLWLFPLEHWLRSCMPKGKGKDHWKKTHKTTNRVIRRALFSMTRAPKQFFSTPTTKLHCIFINRGLPSSGFWACRMT